MKDLKEQLIFINALYLANLMLLPGIAFLILLYLYYRHADNSSALLQSHLRFAIRYSVGAGVALMLMPLIILLPNINEPYWWMLVLTAWVSIHAAFILAGVVSLSRAMNSLPAFSITIRIP